MAVRKTKVKSKVAPARKLVSFRPEKLERFRKQLLARREALSGLIHRETTTLLNEEAAFADSVDQASAETTKTLQFQMQNREKATLHEIEVALKRIDAGRFGQCDRCQESIAEARMRAYPATTLCIDCKAELESESHRFLAR